MAKSAARRLAAARAPARPRESFADRAFRELKRRILANELPAGTQLMEHEAAELLGMSRTPTREAMLRLAGEGLVEVRPRHGMRVRPVSVADMREIYQVLTGLEATAAALCAERGLADKALSELRRAVADMDEALARDDLDAWARADMRFHQLLVQHAGNARLKAVVDGCLEQSHRVRMLTLRLRPRPTASNRDHEAVVEAIARRDPDAARRVHHDHRDRHGRMLIQLLESHGLTQV